MSIWHSNLAKVNPALWCWCCLSYRETLELKWISIQWNTSFLHLSLLGVFFFPLQTSPTIFLLPRGYGFLASSASSFSYTIILILESSKANLELSLIPLSARFLSISLGSNTIHELESLKFLFPAEQCPLSSTLSPLSSWHHGISACLTCWHPKCNNIPKGNMGFPLHQTPKLIILKSSLSLKMTEPLEQLWKLQTMVLPFPHSSQPISKSYWLCFPNISWKSLAFSVLSHHWFSSVPSHSCPTAPTLAPSHLFSLQ